ncbi:tetratricopeptide repeat protein [Arenimonas terrae]|jgi:tetratricopeptide (TPR) repeat protein|uniref:Tetratricopeptide repeat protein n=1 Tax=Arenimonas terrae TaxID=2546226 RepID=A0A5C4RQM0_9GAMM|nr:tetratricopeptide repeat protein [Arenimonas terrae]TNJ33338.1 tetratricopeptide repeat protein [Arenimonas terrae]
MNSLHPLKLAALVLLVTSMSATDVDAARRDKKEEAAALYPDATRESPEAVYTQRLSKQIQKLQDAYNADGKEEETIAAAQAILDNKMAKAYDRGIALLLAGSASIDLGNDDQAIDYLKRAIDENGLPNDNHYSAMLSLASVYINTDRNDEAAVLLQRVVDETKTTKPEVFALQGANLYNAGKYAEAIAPLKRAIELKTDGEDQQSMNMLLSAYAETGNDTAAIATAEELHRKNPDDKRALMNLATLYGNADMQDKAVALLDSARQRGMLTDANDYQRLYSTYFGMQREKEAAAVIEEGLAKNILPADGKTYAVLAQAHYFSDNVPAAIAAAQKGAPLASDGELALFLAQVLGQEDRNAEAKAAGQQALAKGLKNPGEAWMTIARAEYNMENVAAAQAAYREAAKDPSTRSQAQKNLAQISR